jgi:hypothetical protein
VAIAGVTALATSKAPWNGCSAAKASSQDEQAESGRAPGKSGKETLQGHGSLLGAFVLRTAHARINVVARAANPKRWEIAVTPS